MDTERLLSQARVVANHAYAPYSHFQVGVALRTVQGQYFVGCNVENVSFGLTFCAEACAIGQMIAAGETRIAEVLVLSPHEEFCAPCGSCRQQLAEFSAPETPVHLATQSGTIQTVTLSELLPFSFNADTLQGNTSS